MKLFSFISTSIICGVCVTAIPQAVANSTRSHSLGMAGTGCPATQVESSTDGSMTVFQVNFSGQYQAPKNDTKRVSCSFALPIDVPASQQFVAPQVIWNLKVQGRSTFKRKYFFAGEPGTPWKSNQYHTSHNEVVIEEDQPLLTSPCGRSVTFRINSNIGVNS
ncbi:MAG: Unknown protein, partial [uncultured Thiotrichaceae bacterium]